MHQLFFITFNPKGPGWFILLVALFGLVINVALLLVMTFLMAWAASKGWAAA